MIGTLYLWKMLPLVKNLSLDLKDDGVEELGKCFARIYYWDS